MDSPTHDVRVDGVPYTAAPPGDEAIVVATAAHLAAIERTVRTLAARQAARQVYDKAMWEYDAAVRGAQEAHRALNEAIAASIGTEA